jgi:hypothetical protein
VGRGTGSEKTFRLERDLEDACGRLAKAQGIFHRKYKGPGRRSHPDRLFAKRGFCLWIEFKLPGNTPTELQWLEIRAMRRAGLRVTWTSSYRGFEKILANYWGPA